MSLASKITLTSSVIFAGAMIGYVHFKQYSDREQLHKGVLKDLEMRQMRKTENIYNLQKQLDLAKQLRIAETGAEEKT